MIRERGTIVDIYVEEGVTRAEVDIGRASRNVFLTLLMNARVGDDVLIERDLAISIITRKREIPMEVE